MARQLPNPKINVYPIDPVGDSGEVGAMKILGNDNYLLEQINQVDTNSIDSLKGKADLDPATGKVKSSQLPEIDIPDISGKADLEKNGKQVVYGTNGKISETELSEELKEKIENVNIEGTLEITNETDTLPSNYAVNKLVEKLYNTADNIEYTAGNADVSFAETSDYYYQKNETIAGRYIYKIKLNVSTAGALTVLAGKNINTTSYSRRILKELNLETGVQEVLINENLEAGETIGFGRVGDPCKFKYNNKTANPIAGGFMMIDQYGRWLQINDWDLGIGISFGANGDIIELKESVIWNKEFGISDNWTNISASVVNGKAYRADNGKYETLSGWSSIGIVNKQNLPIAIKGAVAQNAVLYSSDTQFDATTMLGNIEPLTADNKGVYRIDMPNNCKFIGVNFKDTDNTSGYSKLQQAEIELVKETTIKEKVQALDEQIKNIDTSQKDIQTAGAMYKNRQLFDANNKTLVYSQTGYGTLVHMFFAGDFNKVEDTKVIVEVDGGITSLEGTLYELLGIGLRDSDNDIWNYQLHNSLGGKNGVHNGVYLNYKIPFHSEIKIYLQKDEASPASPAFWFTCRTIESLDISIAGIKIPTTAVMRTYITESNTAPLQYHEILNTQKNGAVIALMLNGQSANYSFLEACIRAYVGNSQSPIYLSSGLEDYFLGTYYWDHMNRYYNDVAGLTYFKDNKVSAYRLHIIDPLFYLKGGYKLTVRCGETMHGEESGSAWDNPATTSYKTRIMVYEWD